jgi:putative restriction endonuclease
MNNQLLSYYVELFQNLNVNGANTAKSGFTAPHQPVLALSLIQAFERGLVSDERIYLTPELVGIFTTNWSVLVTSGNYHPTIALPFYHISSMVKKKKIRWWNLIPRPGYEILLESGQSIRSLRALNDAVDHARIDIELALILTNETNREVLRRVILEKYFPDKVSVDLRLVRDKFDEISNQIVNEDAATYQASIQRLKELSSGDEKLREVFQQEIFVRGGVFKRDVPKYYKYTCCISGLKVDATFSVSMIDACHIKPFSASNDDTITNGIALCPNLHRAFDRGLIAVDDEFKVIVSERFSEENSSLPYSIRQFAGMPITRPDDSKMHPHPDNFAWHRKHIFKI